MFTSCAYHKCSNVSRDIVMFKFPVCDEDRLLLWIQNSGNPLLSSLTSEELRHCYICAAHFHSSDVHQSQEYLECELDEHAAPIHYQCTEVGATLTQTSARVDIQTDVISSLDDCKVETRLSPMKQEQHRPSVSRSSDSHYFAPINLRQIKRELFTTDNEIENDTLSTSPTKLNNSMETEHNVREEEIKDEPMTYKELDIGCLHNIKIENTDVNDINDTTLTDDVINEDRDKVVSFNVDVLIEEMKTEKLEEVDHEESAGAAPAEKCKETHAEKIQDGSKLTPDGKNMKKSKTRKTSAEKATNRNISNYVLRGFNTAVYKSNVCVDSDDCSNTDVGNTTQAMRTFVCDDCGDVFGDQCLLKEHTEQHVADDKTSSKQRTRLRKQKFTRTGVVNKRAGTHSGNKLFDCEICKVRFKQKGDLKKHLRIHTGEKPYECDICKVRFTENGLLKRHLRVHTGEKPYQCDICKVRFTEKGHLKSHLRIHTGEKPYECQLCKVTFTQSNSLKNHLRNHTGEKPYECNICKVRFGQKSHLNTHLNSHTGERPYQCEICKVRFTLNSTLKNHLRYHTGEKPYKCEICKVRFSNKGTLQRHLRIHTGEKPFECEICKVRFTRKDQLNKHFTIHSLN